MELMESLVSAYQQGRINQRVLGITGLLGYEGLISAKDCRDVADSLSGEVPDNFLEKLAYNLGTLGRVNLSI